MRISGDRRRQWLVRLVFTIYWLLLLEGILRKWVFPEWGRVLFFLRDPFVLLLYALALVGGMKARRSPFLLGGLLFAALSLPLILVQYAFIPRGFSWMLAAYGWRNYFLYFPLAFLVAKYFQLSDVQRVIRWTLLLSIPVAVLAYLQFMSPAKDAINQGLGKTPDLQYANAGVALGVVRTFGTFTSAPGQAAFIASCAAMLLALWMIPGVERPMNRLSLLAATAAIASCLAVCGSRGALIWTGLICCASFPAAATIGRRLAFRVITVPLLLIVAGLAAVPRVFPLAVEALAERWEGAGASETQMYGPGGVFARAAFEVFSFRFLLGDTPLQGYQFGIGGNAAQILGIRADRVLVSDQQAGSAESDWGRQILEMGPVMGIAFILFRIAFTLWLGREAIQATRRSRNPLPILLFVFVAVLLFNGQITGHGTLNGYAWLFAGFSMALHRNLLHPRLLGVPVSLVRRVAA